MVKIPQCKITVLKKTFHQDLVDTYLEEGWRPSGPCECFREGEEFIVDPSKPPEEFHNRCPWAWADIYRAIMNVSSGANTIGAKKQGLVIVGCNDWFRPVIFKIERLG
ncbi:MAG: TIGR04076 family protein [Candidatus Bathyarchaeota archaeon]